MKKLLISVLCIMMMCFSVNVKAENDINPQDLFVENNEASYTDEFEMDFEIDGLTYYPFVYRADNVWFIENVIGPTNCQEGYLYVKNLDTGRIIQLVSQPIDIFRETDNGLYFIYANNVFFVIYDGQSIEKIYGSNGILNNNILELRNNDLYFCEDNKIVKYNTVTEDKTTVVRASNVTMLYIKSDNEIVYEENNNIHYIDGRSGARSTNRIITDEYEYNNLFVENASENDFAPQAIATQVDTNLTSVKNGYPQGSRFTGSYSRFNATQCMGYAMWACDTYAHLSDWENHSSSEPIERFVRFSNDSDVLSFFSSCYVGSYVRLTRATYSDGGFHSVFYVGNSSPNITTYECNLYGNCEVSFITRSLSSYRSFCKGIDSYLSHSYSHQSNVVKYNSTYHIQKCTNSGCSGYRYEGHYSPGPNMTKCVVCGYEGNITCNYPLD